MAEPPPAPAVPPADGSDPIALNAVIGITVGGTVGLVLFLICCICCIKRCNKRRRGFRQDLEQPLDLKGDGGSSNTNPILAMRKGMGSGRKESELVVSKAVDANLDDHDLLVANGLNPDCHSPGKLSQVNVQLPHSSSAHARLQQTPTTAAAGGGSMSILRWLENAELPRTDSGVNGSSTSPTGVASGPLSGGVSGALPKGVPLSRSLPHGSSRFSGFSMRAIIGRLDTGELAEMRRRLLLAAGTVYHGDSSAVPLDVKGIVFARLPPSRMASPAPSTVMDTASVANSGISRSVRVKRNIDLTHPELGTPEQQAQQASVTTSRSLPRHGAANLAAASAATPAVYVGSAGGVTFASIGSLARTSLRAGVDQPPLDQDPGATLPVSRNAWGSAPRYVSGAGVIPGQTVDPSIQSQAYNHAMVLERAGKGSPQQQVNGLPPRVPGAEYIPSRTTPTRNHTAQHAAVTDLMSEGGLHGAPGDMTVTLGPLSGSQYGASSASSLNMFQFPTVEAKGQVVGTPKAAHQMTGQ